MSRIIGCQHLHIAEVTKDDLTGATFAEPQAVPSLIGIDIKDNSESITFYSDDVAEQVINSFSGKEVTIELGYLSNELESAITGNQYKNGVFYQSAASENKEYALLFRAPLSRGGFQHVCLYKGVLSRSETAYKTKEDSTEGQTVTLTGVFMPLQFNGKVFSKANTGDTGNEATLAKWFTEVQLEPAAAPAKIIK